MDNKAQWSLVAAAWVLAIGVLGLGVYAIRHFGSAASGSGAAAPGIQTFGTAAKPLCPVDRVEVVLGPETPKVNYNGATYYFCSNLDPLGRSHKMLFLMDPLLYLTGKSGHPTPEPAAAQPSPAPQGIAFAVPKAISAVAAVATAAVTAVATAIAAVPAPTATATPQFIPF